MSTQLRASNLSHTMDDEDLERLFAPYGNVRRACVVIDPRTGRSTGCGLVEMESDGEATAAMSALDGKEHCGQTLRVCCDSGDVFADGAAAGDPARYPSLGPSMNVPADGQTPPLTLYMQQTYGPRPGDFGDRGGDGGGGGQSWLGAE